MRLHYILSNLNYIWFQFLAELKMDEQLKERDVKYSDLDSKFSRLHKRAKQRIQEVQKVNQL